MSGPRPTCSQETRARELSASITGSVLTQHPRSSRSWPCSLPASSQPSVFGVDPTGGYTEQTSEHGPSTPRLRGSWQAPLGRSSPVTLWSSVLGPCESEKPGDVPALTSTVARQIYGRGQLLGADTELWSASGWPWEARRCWQGWVRRSRHPQGRVYTSDFYRKQDGGQVKPILLSIFFKHFKKVLILL